MVDRIGADAARHLLELGKILLDLADIDRNVRTERVLLPPKRRVGYALELLARANRRLRHFDRHPKPSPGPNDDPCHGGEQRRRDAHISSAIHSAWLPALIYTALCLPAYFGTKLRPASLTLFDWSNAQRNAPGIFCAPYWRRSVLLL